MLAVIFAPLMLLNLLVDYLNRSRFGTIHASSAGIELHRLDGRRVTIDWSELRRIEPISIGTLDFIAGRGRGGIRLVSDHARVLVFRQIRGFDELLGLVRDATGVTSGRGTSVIG